MSTPGDEEAGAQEIDPAVTAEHGVAEELDRWWSGLRLPSTCAHSGSWLSGKNLPVTRKSGVSTGVTI